MIRWGMLALQLAEIFVSAVVHLMYGFYLLTTAVAGDLSVLLNECFFKPILNIDFKEDVPKGTSTNADGLPPIVLLHGIFGFGKEVFHLSSSFFKRKPSN